MSVAAWTHSSSAPSPACARQSSGTRPSTAQRTPPPGTSKHEDVRYLDIHEGKFDEEQFVDWVGQASQLPGERM